MPTPNSTVQSVQAEFLDNLLSRVKNFLPYLEPDEIRRVLTALRDIVILDIERTSALDARRTTLFDAIPSADYPHLLAIHNELNELEMERFIRIPSVPALHENCTQNRDLLIRQTLALVTGEMIATGKGAPPLPFALISMGSDGRGEQTLITDQDHLVVYEDGGDAKADEYFREFSELVVERLSSVGFKKCTGDIMPSNPTWRGSFSQWRRKLLAIVRYEYEDYAKNLMDLIVLSDARFVAGDKKLAKALIDLIRGLEQDYFQVLWGMAKAATEMKLALGFLKRFWTEGSGEHKGEFNLKLLAWAPLIMNVRILAINQGIPATNTVRRIEMLQEEKSFSAATAAGLKEAYQVLTRHRILQQVKVIKGVQNDSYYINPYNLAEDEREKIRQALLRIEELQKMIHTNFSIM